MQVAHHRDRFKQDNGHTEGKLSWRPVFVASRHGRAPIASRGPHRDTAVVVAPPHRRVGHHPMIRAIRPEAREDACSDSPTGAWQGPRARAVLPIVRGWTARIRVVRGPFGDIEPVDMTWTAAGDAAITWSDGHRSTYAPALLRQRCPCAECKGTHGGPPKAFRVLTTSQVQTAPRQVVIEAVEPVGNYAISFTWGDGHREGIYSWSFLRAQCPCDDCRAVSGGGAPTSPVESA